MARKTQTRGKCTYCEREMTQSGMTRHLADCSKRLQAIAEANEQSSGKEQTLFHLQVQDAYCRDYWLHLEMNGTATLRELDSYLRTIWLECCGHMSQFSLSKSGWGDEVAKSRKAEKVFAPDVELTHIYDFGTSTETHIRVVGMRTGKPTTHHPLALLARNDMPATACMECGQPANWLCIECLQEYDRSGELCETHVAEHPHDQYGEPMLLVNSPRAGVCGYEGPAKPPY